MQVNTFHVQPHSVAAPKSLKFSLSTSQGSENGAVDAGRRDSNRVLDSVQSYTDLLRRTPEVRGDVVEAARQRLASGEYLTAKAAKDAAIAVVRQS